MYWIDIFNLQWKMKTPDAVVAVSSCFPRASWDLGKWGQVLQTGIIFFLRSVATWMSLLMKTPLLAGNVIKMKQKTAFNNLEINFFACFCFTYPIKCFPFLSLSFPKQNTSVLAPCLCQRNYKWKPGSHLVPRDIQINPKLQLVMHTPINISGLVRKVQVLLLYIHEITQCVLHLFPFLIFSI